jgi:hypothetical protein
MVQSGLASISTAGRPKLCSGSGLENRGPTQTPERSELMRKQLCLLCVLMLAVGLARWSLAADEVSGKKVDKSVSNASNNADRATGDPANKADDKIGSIDVKTEKSPGQTADLPAGIQKATKDDSEDIRSALADTAEAVMSKSLHKVRNHLVDADRNRLKDLKDDDATLAGRIEQIRKDWKAKYGKDFDIEHKIAFGPDFKGFTIVQGEIANPALLSNWPVDNKSKAGASGSLQVGDTKVEGQATVAGSNTSATATGARDETNKPGNKPGDRNLEKGRNVAIVTFPASKGAPEVTASMIHELPDQWRIDIPDTIDSQKFYQNLLAHMTEFGEMKDQWPTDANEASRMITQHVLEALYDMPAKNAK